MNFLGRSFDASLPLLIMMFLFANVKNAIVALLCFLVNLVHPGRLNMMKKNLFIHIAFLHNIAFILERNNPEDTMVLCSRIFFMMVLYSLLVMWEYVLVPLLVLVAILLYLLAISVIVFILLYLLRVMYASYLWHIL